jgi:hypothetical protein
VARHPFDPVSFVLGGVAIASGAVVLADRSLTDDARVLLPAGLIALGIALFARVVRGDSRPTVAGRSADPVPPAVARPGTDPTFTDEDPTLGRPVPADTPPLDTIDPDLRPSGDAAPEVPEVPDDTEGGGDRSVTP